MRLFSLERLQALSSNNKIPLWHLHVNKVSMNYSHNSKLSQLPSKFSHKIFDKKTSQITPVPKDILVLSSFVGKSAIHVSFRLPTIVYIMINVFPSGLSK